MSVIQALLLVAVAESHSVSAGTSGPPMTEVTRQSARASSSMFADSTDTDDTTDADKPDESPDSNAHLNLASSAKTPAALKSESTQYINDGTNDEDDDEDDDRSQLHYGTEVDINRRYLWRGLSFSDGPVLQPMIFATAYDVTLFVWSNLLLADGLAGHFTTVVPGVSYTAQRYGVDLEADILWYIQTSRLARPRSSAEIKVAATYFFNASFEAHTRHFVDITRQDGAYFGMAGPGLKHIWNGWDLTAAAEVAFATAAFNSDYFDVDAAAINMVQASVQLQHSLGEWVDCTLHAEASELLDPALRQERPPTTFNFGLTVGLEL
jgi:hypothetical protein